MKNQTKFTILLFILVPFLLKAQFKEPLKFDNCFTDQLHKKMLNEHAVYNAKHKAIEKLNYSLKDHSIVSANRSMATQTIPVVVHVIHQNGAENISDGQVFDAIQHLNEAFANTGFYDPNTGVDTEIEFCLAQRDPENNLSNGINRIESPLTNVISETQDLDLKALIQWDPFDYLNIWVVNEITSQSAGAGVAGYAVFPAAHGLPEDGIVLEATYFGLNRDNSKVLVHEAGHYLGLYHTFQGGCSNADCQRSGDLVCDTPPDQSTAPVSCGENINTCDSDEEDTSTNNPFRSVALGGLGDQNDMYINYMDYGDLPCYSVFTNGQKERMTDALLVSRNSLMESFGCKLPCEIPSFEASFQSNPSSPVLVGGLVSFTNTSTPTDFHEWYIDGQPFSNSNNSTYTFNEEGVYKVSLVIRDANDQCESTFEQIIEVICEGEASFGTSNTDIIEPGETITFTNTGSGNSSYEWYLDGNLYSTDTDINITFDNPGYYSLYLVGNAPTCSNYSTTLTIVVGTCIGEDKSEMHWYFGENAALDFNSGEPVFVPGSQVNAFEGTASISDDNGALLFYTDGVRIWDVNNNVMPNGSDLLGGPTVSAYDQALIIPRPHTSGQYYVFTCDEVENGQKNGVRYSIVDMNLNGGLGDVTNVKNVFLCNAFNETMNAAYHDDGQKAWLVISNRNIINTYLIDSNGVGPAIPFSNPNFNADWRIAIFLNSGKKFLVRHQDMDNFTLVLFDFDNVNGTFSNPIEINTSSPHVSTIEVSPDDSKLYCSLIRLPEIEFDLYQFDLSLTTGAAISNSKTFIGDLQFDDRFRLAPNGKIYTTWNFSANLGVIDKPSESGIDCDFDNQSIDISPGFNRISLPKFIRGQRKLVPNINLGPDQIICDGLTTVLDAGDGDYDFVWQDGSTNQTFTSWLPGTYWVTASNLCGSVTDSINISSEELNLVDLGDEISLCEGSELTLDAGTLGDYYLWQDGSNSSTLTVSEIGNYWVEVSTQTGCYQVDSVTVKLDSQALVIDCPDRIYTTVTAGTSELFLSPSQPDITGGCLNTLVNNFTNTDDASANYPTGATTTITWTVTDDLGNSATCDMDVTIDVTTSTSILTSESLILYPNPSNGIFVLENIQANNVNEIQVSVFDPLGRKVYQQSEFLQGTMFVDLTAQSMGVYFLHWSTKENSGVFKMIVE